jgi:hypothetical protein
VKWGRGAASVEIREARFGQVGQKSVSAACREKDQQFAELGNSNKSDQLLQNPGQNRLCSFIPLLFPEIASEN